MRNLVLWGHDVNEYKEMFDLSEEEIHTKILEFGCGPSAVNTQLNKKNIEVVSCDPLFVLDKDTLYSKSVLIFSQMAEEIKAVQDHFDFSQSGGFEHLLAKRKAGFEQFFADYPQGKTEGRYLGVNDCQLPFADFTFDFALCSHYLFADLENQSVAFHLDVLRELARVAKEVRIFPLIDKDGNTSPFLGPVLLSLQQENYGIEVREVAFHLQKSGNAMLRVWAQECKV
ncbi:hypothetical protein [Legionella worsleiensis]|uniref:SAM-dependent methyltransferase n=1 Tax=Legionella worsleiensis TaxID=45076 RepID=A0A0W1AIL2_9GAMM|nr:hypothetical protein [Legionella worsleiensis]KTD81210.1 hypothetical protein Lwor_0888 [Legionella worsleiensis]STY33187.1 SAM-dependent methyltransferase [Legionella worsleiensis]